MSSTGVDIKTIKRIMREDLADAGIEPDEYLGQKSKEEKIYCVHCGTLILDIMDVQDYTPESRLVRCDTCGEPMHANCAIQKLGNRETWFCLNCIKFPPGVSYGTFSGSVSSHRPPSL